ncbi:hypothetical protein [Streptomyces sp. NPDC058330]|uniref:hypothetical protein n=1 Tax=Streptomyces sp. NPDC058330 TaxID=3346449 RepID=UPI0036E9FA9E
MFAALAAYAMVSIALMIADERATAVSDPAGRATTKAALFLEALLEEQGERRSQDSALDSHGRAFGQLCSALRTQARYLPREALPSARDRLLRDSERLVVALKQGNERYLFAEGAERETAVCELARLVSNALRHSCPPRNSRNSLLVFGPHLLSDVPSQDGTSDPTEEPLQNRLRRWTGWLAAAAALFTAAVVLPGGGVAADVLVLAGAFSVASVFPPLRSVFGLAVAGGAVRRSSGRYRGGSGPDATASDRFILRRLPPLR